MHYDLRLKKELIKWKQKSPNDYLTTLTYAGQSGGERSSAFPAAHLQLYIETYDFYF